MVARVRETPAAVLAVRRSLEPTVRQIAREAHVPDAIVDEHVSGAVLEVLDVLGARYVRDMGGAVARVERAREVVHAYYERALTGDTRPLDPATLRDSFRRLQEALKDLVGPKEWAKRERARREADPMAGTEEMDVTRGTPRPVDPGAPVVPRWATDRTAARTRTLAKPLQDALTSAGQLRPDLVAAVLRGEPGVEAAVRPALMAQGMGSAEADAAVAALAAIRDPATSYALGGTATPGARTERAAVRKAYDALPETQQDAVEAAAAVDPEFVRAMVTAEVGYGEPHGRKTPWRPAEMDRFCSEHGIFGERRQALEDALVELNREHRGEQPEPAQPQPATRRGRRRGASIDAVADQLGLPRRGRIAAELRRCGFLRDLASRAPEHFLDLASGWLEYAERRAAAGKRPATLRSYVLALMRTQVRGLVGELTAVFQLGSDAWVLKAPDLRVTDPGTDFVVVMRRSGETWFCDNKALSDASLSRVSSLVENIGQNMADDVAEFGPEIDRLRLSPPNEVVDAVANARTAAAEIQKVVGHLSPDERKSPSVQQEITRICDRNRIRRVVTTSAGELTTLSADLAALGIDLANLEHAIPTHPSRPLTGGGTGGRP
jgi:hypothetical protein